ncbi:MAG: hypothetical protein K2G70_03190 [Turicibacter sp.]|nr:hypothetical protein [Turicibacter sp.]
MLKNTLIGLVKFILKVILGFILFLLIVFVCCIISIPIAILVDRTAGIILVILMLGGIVVFWQIGNDSLEFIKEKILKRKRNFKVQEEYDAIFELIHKQVKCK